MLENSLKISQPSSSSNHPLAMNAISAYPILDTRHQKKDGSYPIKLRVVLNRKSFEIAMGHAIAEKDWDDRQGRIKSNCKSVGNTTRLNNLLQKRRTEAIEIITKLDDDGLLRSLSLKEIRSRITGTSKAGYTYAFFDDVIARMQQAGQVGNARIYEQTYKSIKRFAGETDFPMRTITYRWLKQYESWYLSRRDRKGRPNTLNGLAIKLRTLRALMNRAIKSSLIGKDDYPFTTYKITHEKTRKRAIEPADLAKIKALDRDTLTLRQKRAQDYFFISFYLMGASFIDLAFLKVENVINGRIEYKRRKTGRLHSIKITPPLQKLLDRYLRGKKDAGDTILNIIKGRTEDERYTSARDELRRYNRALKDLGKMAGLQTTLTSYTARHSYASIAKNKGVPIAVISEALGHENVDVTQVYLNSFDTSVLDEYNDLVTKI